MLYLTVIVGCVIFGWLLVAQRRLRPCDATSFAGLMECRALVGRRGHRVHVWQLTRVEFVLRDDDSLYRRNLTAIMAEERIGLAVINPSAFVISGVA